MSNLDIAYQFFSMVENKELDKLDEVIDKRYRTKDTMTHNEAKKSNIMDHSKLHLKGVDGLKKRMNILYNQFDDISFDIFETVVEADKVVFYYNMEMVHTGVWNGFPATGKRLKVTGVHLMIFENGKIIKIVALLSIIDMIKQIGAKIGMSEEEVKEYLNRVKSFLRI